jgi:hypothetical protein
MLFDKCKIVNIHILFDLPLRYPIGMGNRHVWCVQSFILVDTVWYSFVPTELYGYKHGIALPCLYLFIGKRTLLRLLDTTPKH